MDWLITTGVEITRGYPLIWSSAKQFLPSRVTTELPSRENQWQLGIFLKIFQIILNDAVMWEWMKRGRSCSTLASRWFEKALVAFGPGPWALEMLMPRHQARLRGKLRRQVQVLLWRCSSRCDKYWMPFLSPKLNFELKFWLSLRSDLRIIWNNPYSLVSF